MSAKNQQLGLMNSPI